MVYPRFVLAAAAGAVLMLGLPAGALAAKSGVVVDSSAKRVQIADSSGKARSYKARGKRLRTGTKVSFKAKGRKAHGIKKTGRVRSVKVRGTVGRWTARKLVLRLEDGSALSAETEAAPAAPAGDEVVVVVEEQGGEPVVTEGESVETPAPVEAPAPADDAPSVFEGIVKTADPFHKTLTVGNADDSGEPKTFQLSDALFRQVSDHGFGGGTPVKVTYHHEGDALVADAVDFPVPACVEPAMPISGENLTVGIFGGGDWTHIAIRDAEYHYTEYRGNVQQLIGGKAIGGGTDVVFTWHDEGGEKVIDQMDVAPVDACDND